MVFRSLLVVALLAGCAADVHRTVAPGMASTEVQSRIGQPQVHGRLPNGDEYWDYSRQPYYTDRVVFGPDQRVREVRNLLGEENFKNLRPGMSMDEVVATVGPAVRRDAYGNGTTSWTWRYHDVGIAKLLHVTFDPSGRVLRYETEWDPDVFSKREGGPR